MEVLDTTASRLPADWRSWSRDEAITSASLNIKSPIPTRKVSLLKSIPKAERKQGNSLSENGSQIRQTQSTKSTTNIRGNGQLQTTLHVGEEHRGGEFGKTKQRQVQTKKNLNQLKEKIETDKHTSKLTKHVCKVYPNAPSWEQNKL